MESCQGSVESYMSNLSPDTPVYYREEFALQVVRQRAMALEAAHDAGLVHADVNPSNILLSTFPAICGKSMEEGSIKLADFGLAFPKSDAHLPRSPRGTPSFTAPEMERTDERRAKLVPVAVQVDMYSLGKTLHYMLIWSEREAPRVITQLSPLCTYILDNLLSPYDEMRMTASELMDYLGR